MSKFKLRVNRFFDNIKQIKIDKNNRKLFISDIQKEVINPNSKFNNMKLSVDNEYKNISCLINIPENYQLEGSDAIIYSKLKDESIPISRYISSDLNWGEYFIAPEFYHIEDEEDINNVSCTYIATWKYEPVLKKYPSFWYEFAAFIGINLTIIAGFVTGLILLF